MPFDEQSFKNGFSVGRVIWNDLLPDENQNEEEDEDDDP